jgi:hypothetical protein
MKILMTTHSKCECYVDMGIAILDDLWPVHPELIVVSDRGDFQYPNRVIVAPPDWLGLLRAAVTQLINRGMLQPDEIVLLLLEDHIPDCPVDDAVMTGLEAVMQQDGCSYLALIGEGCTGAPLYSAPVDVTLYESPKYSSLHPALWKVSHILRTLDRADEVRNDDPWAFENTRVPGVRHLTTTQKVWPSRHGGFLWRGMVSVPALQHLTHESQRPLRRKLLWKFLPEIPGRIGRRFLHQFGMIDPNWGPHVPTQFRPGSGPEKL